MQGSCNEFSIPDSMQGFVVFMGDVQPSMPVTTSLSSSGVGVVYFRLRGVDPHLGLRKCDRRLSPIMVSLSLFLHSITCSLNVSYVPFYASFPQTNLKLKATLGKGLHVGYMKKNYLV